jgi:1-acyl-sn-glycerol-3-phosphate acyltransferase
MVLMSGWIAADALDRDGAAERPGGARLSPGHALQAPHPTRPAKPAPAFLANAATAPRRSAWLVRLFTRHARRYLRRNFHALRLTRTGRPVVPDGEPVVVVLNHPSWWDPLFGLVLAELFPGYKHYAPVEQGGLSKYRFLERLGAFAIEPGTRRGALAFLHRSLAALAQPHAAVWVTAQGTFTDPRARPVTLREGVGHLLRRLDGGVVLPLALEYPFWQERFPEALAHFGAPIPVGRGRDLSAAAWTARLEQALTAAQDALAAAACRRDPALFETLVGGKVGVGGVYDLWRRFKALLRGERFRGAHGDEPVPQPTRLGGVS